MVNHPLVGVSVPGVCVLRIFQDSMQQMCGFLWQPEDHTVRQTRHLHNIVCLFLHAC